MKTNLSHITLADFTTISGVRQDISLSYQVFGQPLDTAPIVLVNHALTGNSEVAGENGWWSSLIGSGKCIDTDVYTILSFNIPGNGYDSFVIENYKDFVAKDIARIFLEGLAKLNIEKLYALIGGSLGGGIAWEMVVLSPYITRNFIPVATDWKATDWLIANCQIQELFLLNSKNPVNDARMHAMLCYRTPESFKEKFKRGTNDELQVFNVESWLLHHGNKLQERFQLSAYKLMNQLLKTIDVTRGSEEQFDVLEKVKANIHIIGVDSDLFFTAEENRETQKILAQTHPNVTYGEINSVHGHDAFLIEFEQLEQLLQGVFSTAKEKKRMKVLKFGGKSLANGKGITNVIDIIASKTEAKEQITVVVSARGSATDSLEELLKTAAKNEDYIADFTAFKEYQRNQLPEIIFEAEFSRLSQLLEGVKLLGDYSAKIKDMIVSQGEIISAKYVTHVLSNLGVKAKFTDTRELIKTDANFGDALPLEKLSKENVVTHFKDTSEDTVHVVTGFIASSENNETTTLGRNGSNYTASLLANFLDAEELQSFTHVDGIFTANPDLVAGAKKIEQLSYNEANELANFGATILHAKTIIPLIEKNIPLRILNTFNDKNNGTLITATNSEEGIKSLSVLENVALVNLEGRGLLGKSGVDARIFKTLGAHDISVSIISQGSSERGIGLVVDADKAGKAVIELEKEFESDFYSKDVNRISIIDDIAVISIIGQDLSTFNEPYSALVRNQIVPVLINNTITGKNVSLVVKKAEFHKALNVVHGEIFGISKRVNLFVFGKGLVGSTLIKQLQKSREQLLERKNIRLNIVAVANSSKAILNAEGITTFDANEFDTFAKEVTVDDIVAFANDNHLENKIAIDVTASSAFVSNYIPLVENGFDLVSANKIANTIGLDFYKELRAKLEQNKKSYLYETNVGAGLPLIDTIRLLHHSGENITKIRGIFSGTLSYIFNRFSDNDVAFSDVLQDAITNGFTEPDPREDLCGNDVGRKLLILARELDLQNEFEDVKIENLIPKGLREGVVSTFISNLEKLNEGFQKVKNAQKEDHVLRYVGELHGNLADDFGASLDVKLVSVPKESALGQVKGSDSIFEIYTESYGEQPLVIQGAGAGAEVTARGVFGDILRLTEKK